LDLDEALLDDGEVAVQILPRPLPTSALMEKVITSLTWMLLAISVSVCVDDIKFISNKRYCRISSFRIDLEID
jgi:hypothetical protein